MPVSAPCAGELDVTNVRASLSGSVPVSVTAVAVLWATGTDWSVAVGAVLGALTTVEISTWFGLVGEHEAVKSPRK